MDSELRCNRLTCRQPLNDKAVVTTCSHIFCLGCANELFTAARLCPACETTLTEPDDVVVCSLHPTNDYKTSVLSGLNPSIILEICSRAISFWQYQIHQESVFQQAVVRNMNDKTAQLQKQLDNIVREANGEIALLGSKNAELERDLEHERRRIHELQESSRERDKDYQKLKIQYDKIKRKALLGPKVCQETPIGAQQAYIQDTQNTSLRSLGQEAGIDFGAAVSNMDANRVQRTPLAARTQGPLVLPQQNHNWQPQPARAQTHNRNSSHRQPFAASTGSYRSGNLSDRSESANEVENILIHPIERGERNMTNIYTGWSTGPQKSRSVQRVFAPTTQKRTAGGFRPAMAR